jgi:hypothetical protein
MPPRVAKAYFTGREVAEMFAYCERNPIDDQSNFHLPIAGFQALYVNANRAQGSKEVSLRDFLLFRERSEENDIENDLLSDKW